VIRKPTVEELGLDLDAQVWQRSGDRDGALEVAFVPPAATAAAADSAHRTEWVLMRVAGDPEGRTLVYDRHEWECFLDGARGGEFDDGTWAGPFGDDGPEGGEPGGS
jgi:Domain of unknown function (DUF397)